MEAAGLGLRINPRWSLEVLRDQVGYRHEIAAGRFQGRKRGPKSDSTGSVRIAVQAPEEHAQEGQHGQDHQ